MSAVVPLRPDIAVPPAIQNDAVTRLSDAQRQVLGQRKTLLSSAIRAIEAGASCKSAAHELVLQLRLSQASAEAMSAARGLARRGDLPSEKRIEAWLGLYRKHGTLGLVDRYKGRERKTWGWELRAELLWQREQNPAMATVAYWLRNEGHETATESRVRAYLKSLPERKGENSPKRVGRHYYNQNIRPHVVRDSSVLPVGFVYEGDGHRLKWYTAHHNSGHPFRYEFSPWIDVRSNYCVGWYLSEAESAHGTLFGLSHAIVAHQHVPAAVHVDPGPGFRNKMLCDEVAGYCGKLAIEFMHTLPGNARGKGLVEHFFAVMEERLGKTFDTFTGEDMAPEALLRFEAKIRRGDIRLPSFQQMMEAIAAYIERYNNTHQDKLGCTPAELWRQLQRNEVVLPAEALLKPQEQRVVQRWGVSLFNRLYRNPALADYEGRKLIVEYDLHDAGTVTVRTPEGRYICDATLVKAKPWLSESRIKDLKQKSLQGQRQRLQRHLDEIERRSQGALDHSAQLHTLEQLGGLDEPLQDLRREPLPAAQENAQEKRADAPLHIDPFDIDY